MKKVVSCVWPHSTASFGKVAWAFVPWSMSKWNTLFKVFQAWPGVVKEYSLPARKQYRSPVSGASASPHRKMDTHGGPARDTFRARINGDVPAVPHNDPITNREA